MNSFKAQILTPDGPVFEGEVIGVLMPGTMGSFEVLYNHASLMSTLDIGSTTVRKDENSTEIFAISGGFVEVSDNRLILLAEAAERAEDIDVARAEAAKVRAEKRLNEEEWDRLRAEMALLRAINRIKIARTVQVK